MKSLVSTVLLICVLSSSNAFASGAGFEFSIVGAKLQKLDASIEGKLHITNYKITVKGKTQFKIVANAMYYSRNGSKSPGKAEQAIFHCGANNFKGIKQHTEGKSATIVTISQVLQYNSKIRFEGKVLGRAKTVDFLIVKE